MGLNYCSDYGSGSSSEALSPWGSRRDSWVPLHDRHEDVDSGKMERSSSFIDVTAKNSMEAVMQEFRMNGSDSPYDPEEEYLNRSNGLLGLGPSSAYLRQKSWPAPDRTPTQRLPHHQTLIQPSVSPASSTPRVYSEAQGSACLQSEMLTPEQLWVLSSLPRAILQTLLKELQKRDDGTAGGRGGAGGGGCAFCRSNGERWAWCASHVLRFGGRVRCPVLRALVCSRCGATGDRAHTINYCPLASPDVSSDGTDTSGERTLAVTFTYNNNQYAHNQLFPTDIAEERARSAAMMRSIRSASGRRRAQPAPSAREYVRFGDPTPSVLQDVNAYRHEAPLDPIWAALEKKLML